METSGIEIFATKGTEYIFVIGFLLLLIFFWRFLNRSQEPVNAMAAPDKSLFPLNPRFRIAEGFFYHQGHSWAVPEKQDIARVGIDDFTQQLLGQLGVIDLPQIGARIEQGEKGWRLWVDSKAIDILSPVEGEVIAVNEDAIRSPSLVNRDPYGSGWLMKVKVPNISKNLRNLMSGDLAIAWMKETTDALDRKMKDTGGSISRAVSVPVAGIAKILSPNKWNEVAAKYLSGE